MSASSRCSGSGSFPLAVNCRTIEGLGHVGRCRVCGNEVPRVGSGWLKAHDPDAPYVGTDTGPAVVYEEER